VPASNNCCRIHQFERVVANTGTTRFRYWRNGVSNSSFRANLLRPISKLEPAGLSSQQKNGDGFFMSRDVVYASGFGRFDLMQFHANGLVPDSW